MPETSALIRAGGANTEINAEQESDSEPGGFALSVDLSACMGAQARCRVWVRRRARKVRWLASRVRRVAKLRGPLLLLAGDHLLPPSEPMKVLRRDDTVRIARVEHEWQHAFSIEDSDEDALTLSPTQLSVVQNSTTQTSTMQSSPKKSTTKQWESTNIKQESSVVPAHPSPTQQLSIVQNNATTSAKSNSPKKTTKQVSESTINHQSPVACKRKFTVGDTLFLLKRAEESRTQAPPSPKPDQTSHSQLPKLIETPSKLEYNAQKFIEMDQESVPIDNDALNRVKRRALALLEQVTDEKDTDVVDAPKQKRRRVRRRRPAKLSNPEFIQEHGNSETVQNGSRQSFNPNHHADLTNEQDDLESKAILIKSVTCISPDKETYTTKEDQDSESDDSDINRPDKQPASTAPPIHSVQSSKALPIPTSWMVNYTEMPPEAQIPVLVRDTTPRPPRVVRALGTDTCIDDKALRQMKVS